MAVLYPVTLAGLVAIPGLSPRYSVSLGALASGTAILVAPHALARIDQIVSLRFAFLLPIPLPVVLMLLSIGRPGRIRP